KFAIERKLPLVRLKMTNIMMRKNAAQLEARARPALVSRNPPAAAAVLWPFILCTPVAAPPRDRLLVDEGLHRRIVHVLACEEGEAGNDFLRDLDVLLVLEVLDAPIDREGAHLARLLREDEVGVSLLQVVDIGEGRIPETHLDRAGETGVD